MATFQSHNSCFHVIQDADQSGLQDSVDNTMQEHNETCTQDTKNSTGTKQDTENRVYLEVVPVRSFLHTSCGRKSPPVKDTFTHSPVPEEDQQEPPSQTKEVGNRDLFLFAVLAAKTNA